MSSDLCKPFMYLIKSNLVKSKATLYCYVNRSMGAAVGKKIFSELYLVKDDLILTY